jgi:acetyltransferase-like isoleucine patch superfamily enzyme
MTSGEFGNIIGEWDYSRLPRNVVIGEDCWFEREGSFGSFRSERRPGLVFGNRVRVYAWTTFNVESTGVIEIGDDCLLVGATFMSAGQIVLGKRVILSYQVVIADSDFHPLDPEERKRDAVANAPGGDRSQRPPYVSKPVVIEDDVQIGIGAIVLKGVRIGRGARVGAGAVIAADVPAGAVMVGNPARPSADRSP